MAEKKIFVVRTGTANLASVRAALSRIGCETEVTVDPEEVRTAARVVLPGVGAFGPVVEQLHQLGLSEVLRARVAAGRPTLAICLGLQVLAEASEESPDVFGLGVLPARVTRFSGEVRVPQLGWNRICAESGCRLLESGDAYFANSYQLPDCPNGWKAAWSEHGTPFVAAIERGPVLACQFHPELSGRWGQSLLRRWEEASC